MAEGDVTPEDGEGEKEHAHDVVVLDGEEAAEVAGADEAVGDEDEQGVGFVAHDQLVTAKLSRRRGSRAGKMERRENNQRRAIPCGSPAGTYWWFSFRS